LSPEVGVDVVGVLALVRHDQDLARIARVVASWGQFNASVEVKLPVLKSMSSTERSTFFWGGQQPLVPLLLLGHFFPLLFCVHHPANRDDWHLLAHAMVSDFSVAWPELGKF
jgi:hypothetical protein